MLNLLQSSFPTLEALLVPELMDVIRQQGRRVRYRDGELIQQRGDAITGFAIVESGQVIAGSEGADGNYLTAALLNFKMEFIDGQRRWPLPVRIAHLLLTSVEDRVRADRHIVHCRQQDLAEMLGVSRVAVSKALKALQADARVTMHYGSIELNDVPGLLDWLNDAYQVVPIPPDADWRF